MENTDVLVREDMNKDAKGKQKRFNRKNELDNQKFDMLKLPLLLRTGPGLVKPE